MRVRTLSTGAVQHGVLLSTASKPVKPIRDTLHDTFVTQCVYLPHASRRRIFLVPLDASAV
jgi:hypothetical protein